MIALLWVIAAVVWVALFATAGALVRRRLQRNQSFVQARTEKHEAVMRAITDWLDQPKILAAMYRAGVLTADGRQLLLDHRLSDMTEQEILMTAAALLRDREVRRVIADFTTKRYRLPKATAMRNLLQIQEWGRPPA